MMRRPLFVSPEERQREWELSRDMAERGRRLSAFKEKTAGRVFVELDPGEWRYVSPETAARPRRRRQSERREWGIGI